MWWLLCFFLLASAASNSLPPDTFRGTAWYTTACADAPSMTGGTGTTCLHDGVRPTTGCHTPDASCSVGQRTTGDLRIFFVTNGCLRYEWVWRCAHVPRIACGVYWCDIYSQCQDNSMCICPAPTHGDPVGGICSCGLNYAFNGTICIPLTTSPRQNTNTRCCDRPPRWAFVFILVLLLTLVMGFSVVVIRHWLRDRRDYLRAVRAAAAFDLRPSGEPEQPAVVVDAQFVEIDVMQHRNVLRNTAYENSSET
jgi:hypothetical protein